jgi:hypothetical protein
MSNFATRIFSAKMQDFYACFLRFSACINDLATFCMSVLEHDGNDLDTSNKRK